MYVETLERRRRTARRFDISSRANIRPSTPPSDHWVRISAVCCGDFSSELIFPALTSENGLHSWWRAAGYGAATRDLTRSGAVCRAVGGRYGGHPVGVVRSAADCNGLAEVELLSWPVQPLPCCWWPPSPLPVAGVGPTER